MNQNVHPFFLFVLRRAYRVLSKKYINNLNKSALVFGYRIEAIKDLYCSNYG